MLDIILNSKSKTFLAFCFCFLLGIIIFSIFGWQIKFVYLYLSFFIFASLIIFCWQNKKLVFLFFCFLVFLFGVFRYQLAYPLSDNDISKHYGETLDLQVVVSDEPDVRQDGVRYIVETHSYASVRGKIYLQSKLYPRYNYGDELQLTCRIDQPEALTNGFRYDKYLARLGVFAICTNPQVQKIGENKGNFFYTNIYKLKNSVAQKIQALWSEPQASFMAGLLYGYRGGLGDYNDLFNRTGVSHIVAISGYNISIIASVLSTILIYLWVPRKKAFWLVVSGIILFVIFTGAGASVVRAGVMGIIVLLSKQFGRLSRMTNVLTLAVVLMALQNPLVLIWDAGFQLSLAATCGIVFLSPIVSLFLRGSTPTLVRGEGVAVAFGASKIRSFFEITKKGFLAVCGRLGMTETFSAIIATLPLILYQFGRLSIVAPLVNLLVLWIIPYIMLIGFLSVMLGFIFYPLGQLLAYLAHFGLQYILIIVKWFGELKFAAVDIKISWWGMVIMYVVLIYFVNRNIKQILKKY